MKPKTLFACAVLLIIIYVISHFVSQIDDEPVKPINEYSVSVSLKDGERMEKGYGVLIPPGYVFEIVDRDNVYTFTYRNRYGVWSEPLEVPVENNLRLEDGITGVRAFASHGDVNFKVVVIRRKFR